MTSRPARPWLTDRLPTPLPTRYDHALSRRHARVTLPTTEPIFVLLAPVVTPGKQRRTCRTIAVDLSLGGMCVEVIERNAQGLPPEGDDVVATLERDGVRLDLVAHVLSSSLRKLRLRLVDPAPNDTLALMLCDVVAADLHAVETRGLAQRMGLEHYLGREHLDLRLQRCAPDLAPWWRLVWLDTTFTWSPHDGLRARRSDGRDDLPLPSPTAQRAIISRLLDHARRRLPERAASFDFVAATVAACEHPVPNSL